ncbi:superoxide dismutase, Ni [Candidatus Woesearchaeota archaeon]|nr:superoxide dismutase, Ni [Candidatus Woesearchaeota archaeon]
MKSKINTALKNQIMKLLPTVIASAHCDVPCGIYDPTPAKIAAKTVARMTQQLEELEVPKDSKDAAADKTALLQYTNRVVRRIQAKEEQAQLCKNELSILWTDFFKPAHLEKFPKLHEAFWKATKLCSTNKQEFCAEHAKELLDAVDEIAKMFYEAKGVPERFKAYKEITDKLY